MDNMHLYHLLLGSGWPIAGASVLITLVLLVRQVQLRRASRIFEMVAENARDGVVLQKADATIVWCNEAYCRNTGRTRDFWIGRKPQKWIFPEDIRPTEEEISTFRYDTDVDSLGQLRMRRNLRGDGTEFWNQHSVSVVEMDREGPLYVLVCRDVTEQVNREEALSKAKEKLEHAVNFDSLTGLPNRRMLKEFLENSLIQAALNDNSVGVIHLDLDKFKETNDTHGHAAGDAVLINIADILQRNLKETDLAARLGGDEFIIVRTDLDKLGDLRTLASDILVAMDGPVPWQGINLNIGASLGLAVSEPGQLLAEELIQRADFALYDAKSSGRGRAAVYDHALEARHLARKGMADDLAYTIRQEQLEFYFQPIVSLPNLRMVGIETLARWTHPRKGPISPQEFIPLAQEIGLLEDLDMCAMQAALSAVATLSRNGHDDLFVTFNASFQTLSNAHLVDQLTWSADALDVPHSKIVVEILETVLLDDEATQSTIAEQIEGLNAAGFGTKLDDFGIGYAGLAHLAQLNVQGIKIDRSLVQTMLTDSTSDLIVRAILNLATDLGLDVVAEGVEDMEIARRIHRYNCKFIQGYGIARPMSFTQLQDWMLSYQPSQVGPRIIEAPSAY